MRLASIAFLVALFIAGCDQAQPDPATTQVAPPASLVTCETEDPPPYYKQLTFADASPGPCYAGSFDVVQRFVFTGGPFQTNHYAQLSGGNDLAGEGRSVSLYWFKKGSGGSWTLEDELLLSHDAPIDTMLVSYTDPGEYAIGFDYTTCKSCATGGDVAHVSICFLYPNCFGTDD